MLVLMPKLRKLFCLLLAGLLLLPGAFADSLILPAGLESVGTQTFSGDTSLEEVTLPEGTVSIGSKAFFGCSNLGWITIPGSLSSIGDLAFEGCAPDLLIRTEPGSYAQTYALRNDIDFQAETTYRALLIGQTYPDFDPEDQLDGPAYDVQNLKTVLSSFPDTPYQVTIQENLEVQEMLDAISQTFSGAEPQDVSLFYYSGHGVDSNRDSERGALVGAEGDLLTASMLRTALDKIPGRKIVILDSCFSGNIIIANGRSVSSGDSEAFLRSFISAFSQDTRNSLNSNGYFVLAASSEWETSTEFMRKDGFSWALFTAMLCAGCGFDCADYFTEDEEKPGILLADENDNGVLTLEELYFFTYDNVIAIADEISEYWGADYSQHVQVYPENADWFGPLRK